MVCVEMIKIILMCAIAVFLIMLQVCHHTIMHALCCLHSLSARMVSIDLVDGGGMVVMVVVVVVDSIDGFLRMVSIDAYVCIVS